VYHRNECLHGGGIVSILYYFAYSFQTVLGLLAFGLGFLFYLKYRPVGLRHLCGFQAAFTLMSLRFAVLWFCDLGIPSLERVMPQLFLFTDVLYALVLFLFLPSGPCFILSLIPNRKGRHPERFLPPTALFLALLNLVPEIIRFARPGTVFPPLFRSLEGSVDILGIWAPTAFMVIFSLFYLKILVKGLFRMYLVSLWSLSLALVFAIAAAALGFIPPDFAPIPFALYGMILDIVFIGIGIRWYLNPPHETWAGISEALRLSKGLSAREAEIAARILEGLASREIADCLFISPRTVETHIRNLYRKTGVTSRFELITLLSKG